MDAHPIPQDVTSFQFHLIGDMTLKQFLYLAGGLGFAYLIFVLFGKQYPFFAWPVVVISSLLGGAFAFLPIAERPLDHWVSAYFLAVFNPTKLVWYSKTIPFDSPVYKNRLQNYLATLNEVMPAQTQPIPKPIFQAKPQTQPAVIDASQKNQDGKPLGDLVETAKKAQLIQSQIVETEHSIEDTKKEVALPNVNKLEVATKFQDLLGRLDTLTKEASQLSDTLSIPTPTQTPTKTKVAVIAANDNIAQTKITLTTTPNVINGIVTDSQNNYLDGAIIVTHDKDGLPVRALKSNKLGQFIAATPLPNGSYTLVVEKENLMFDVYKIELKGDCLAPVRVSAKGQTA